MTTTVHIVDKNGEIQVQSSTGGCLHFGTMASCLAFVKGYSLGVSSGREALYQEMRAERGESYLAQMPD